MPGSALWGRKPGIKPGTLDATPKFVIRELNQGTLDSKPKFVIVVQKSEVQIANDSEPGRPRCRMQKTRTHKEASCSRRSIEKSYCQIVKNRILTSRPLRGHQQIWPRRVNLATKAEEARVQPIKTKFKPIEAKGKKQETKTEAKSGSDKQEARSEKRKQEAEAESDKREAESDKREARSEKRKREAEARWRREM
jgi:hypothetical protein